MATLAQKIGLKLRRCRHEAGITQPALAKLLPLEGENSHITISNWERGMRRPTLSHIESYARLFDKPMTWFFSREDSDEKNPKRIRENESIPELIHRIIVMIDELGPNPRLEKAKHHLHRVMMEFERA